MEFSEKLQNIRKEKNLSQEQLAELLGVSPQVVEKWERDSGYPETEKLIRLAQKTGISLDVLLLDRQPGNAIDTTPHQNNTVFPERRRIIIQSSDGKTLSAFYKFTFQEGKGGGPCVLYGIDHTTYWGDQKVLLGWYATRNDAQKELSEIRKAMQNGDVAYQLQYFRYC